MLAKLYIPGSHRLWPAVPNSSARLANFLHYAHWWQRVLQDRYLKINLKKSVLVIWSSQPLFRYSSVNLFAGNKLPGKNLKGLGSSSFARHYSRNHYLFSLPQPTKMFQFSWFPPDALFYSGNGNTTWLVLGFPIRIFPDQSLLTAPRDFSQSSTSFIGIIRLGIHCVLLSTFLCIDLTSNC